MIIELDLPLNRERLDVTLTECLQELGHKLTRSDITKALNEKRVLLSDGTFPKAGLKLTCPCHVKIELSEVAVPRHEAEDLPLDIVFEDEYLLVVNKPRGLVVHPAPGHANGTLVNALLNYCGGNNLSDINGEFRPGIVHRIDKDTSGLLVVAKDNSIHNKLAELLSVHAINRVYQAIVFGNFAETAGKIDAPIGRDPRNRQKMAVTLKGKPALTHFTVLASRPGYSLLRLNLETGRTHQIRVHLSYIGHPVVGDPLYAAGRKYADLGGQLLHAAELHFRHPITQRMIDCYAPLPEVFNTFLEQFPMLQTKNRNTMADNF